MFQGEKTPGKIWAKSSASHILPLVREHQKSRSQIIETKNLMSKPKWMVSKAAQVATSSLTSEPGEVVKFAGTLAPQAWAPPNIPKYVMDLDVFNRKDMDDIMAQRDATKGTNPSGSRSATMLENLQAQDDGQLAIAGLNFDTGFSKVGRLLLSVGDQFISEDRLVSFTGKRNRFEASLLKGGALTGQNKGVLGADYFNVRVTQFSQFGLTRVGQMEFLKVLLQYSIFKPEDRDKIFEFIEMGYFEDAIDEHKIDRSNAHRENLLMGQGQPPNILGTIQPGLMDHHETHLEEHGDYLKGDEGLQLQPQLLQIFQMHIQQHKTMLMVNLVEPQILAIKAQFIAAQMNGIPKEFLSAGRNENSGDGNGTSSSSGTRSSSGGT
jgi:hypothetical protein